jgi:hypothetical protein
MLSHRGNRGTAKNPEKISVNSVASQLSLWFKFSKLNIIIIFIFKQSQNTEIKNLLHLI